MQKKLLSIGEAAAILGIQVDTLRRHERKGLIRAIRTDGDQRRFELAEVQRFAAARKLTSRTSHGNKRATHRGPQPPFPGAAPSRRPSSRKILGQARVDAADSFDDGDAFDADGLAGATTPALAPPFHPRSPAHDIAHQVDHVRLDDIKRFALITIPFSVPDTWRAKVIEDLERYVTAQRFPNYLSIIEARNLVTARVKEVLKAYHESRARETAEREAATAAEQRARSLRSYGITYSSQETASWDFAAILEVRREVERVLEREVKPNWTEGEVQDLVNETLAEWVEEDEDE